jgi:hypothetical protein
VIKVDSMGCDTPGCATGTFIRELSPSGGGQGEVRVWPNPTNGKFEVRFSFADASEKNSSEFEVKGEKVIRIYNSQGIKVEEVKVPEGIDTCTFNAEGWTRGIYFLIVEFSGQLIGSAKIVVR